MSDHAKDDKKKKKKKKSGDSSLGEIFQNLIPGQLARGLFDKTNKKLKDAIQELTQ